jgi:hypothetical protein
MSIPLAIVLFLLLVAYKTSRRPRDMGTRIWLGAIALLIVGTVTYTT